VDEVGLARQYIARKRMKKPEGEDAKKQAARVMGRLMRAGFSAAAIFKVLREWDVEVDEIEEPLEEAEEES
jgi:regulatory protein